MFKFDPSEQEVFVKGVYSSVDEAISAELARLSREDSILSSCQPGCSYCCRYHILTNVLEAHTLAQYLRRELPLELIEDLRTRTLQWHEWDNSRPGRYPPRGLDGRKDLSKYDPCCPLNVDGACIAYPVRPIVCRTHFVCSHPLFCCKASNSQTSEKAPVLLASVLTKTSPLSKVIRDRIETAGLDYSRSIMLLPQWLATEMGWDFAMYP